MNYLTNEKLVIVGAGGMIGSNMVQTALTLGLTPNICLYDIYEPGVHGVFDEMEQCAFSGANLSYTVDPAEAFTGAKYYQRVVRDRDYLWPIPIEEIDKNDKLVQNPGW